MRSWLTSYMKKQPERGKWLAGSCANCNKAVFESEFRLDDAYNVWKGVCPYCGAYNLLSMNHGLRGYDSGGMHLVLPTEEERVANELPDDIPTSGPCGKPADQHGSPLGELAHKLMKGTKPSAGEDGSAEADR
jgi:hypothetical protein